MAELEVRLPSLVEDSGDEEAAGKTTVSFVFPEEGDFVEKDADLIEMVTDKATFVLPAPERGRVKRIAVQEDDPVKAGDLLCILELADK
ncbi:MAG: lipoyl domain-containing protein [Planctomycetota bacterium]